MAPEDEDIRLLLTGAVPPLTAPQDRLGAVAGRVRRQRRRMFAGSALALVLAVGLGVGGVRLLTGAGSPSGTAGPDDAQRWASCAESVPETARGEIPDFTDFQPLDGDFQAVAVVICGMGSQRRPDGGEDLVVTERHGQDVAGLVGALRLPDDQESTGGCLASAITPPIMVMIDAEGRWTMPRIPQDRCGKPRAEIYHALDAMSLTKVVTGTIREIESAESAASGCSQDWKNVFLYTSARPIAGPGRLPAPFPDGEDVRICVYDVPPEGTGRFVRGTVLPVDRRSAIEEALMSAALPAPCTTDAGRFALLRSVTNSRPLIYVELDGCHRVMTEKDYGGPLLAQGDAALAALIDS